MVMKCVPPPRAWDLRPELLIFVLAQGWVETHVGFSKDEPTEIPEIPTEEEAAQASKKG